MKFADESKSLAAAHGYSDFEQWLTAGGDDRSLIKPTGANKYHIKPQPIEAGAVFRGSCTGNPPTQRGYDAAEALYDGTLGPVADDQAKLDEALSAVFQDQRARLTAILELPPGAEVILCPSGSDAEYIPLAIARDLTGPSANISNGITQLREIGAGSAPANYTRWKGYDAIECCTSLPCTRDTQQPVWPSAEQNALQGTAWCQAPQSG